MISKGLAYIFSNTASSGAVCGLDEALLKARSGLEAELASTPAGELHDVLEAHLEMLADPMLQEALDAQAGAPPLEALDAACSQICALFEQIDDEYLKSRADDVKDVCARVRRALLGVSDGPLDIPHGSVLVAEELLPSDTSRLDFSKLAGIITAKGSATSHVCIIAHSKGVPVNFGVDISSIKQGDILTVDDPYLCADLLSFAHSCKPDLAVWANAGSVADVSAAIAAGAQGIGLFRTEFLLLERAQMPSEEEQYQVYKSAVEAAGGRTVTFRAFDIGADKQIPYLEQPREDNPFLGIRGIRFLLARPSLLRAQLRALVRASAHGSVRVLLPMVCTVAEIDAVRDVLSTAEAEFGRRVPLDIMVETPASVFDASALAAKCDGFSIGTNDLTQYIMAADRGNSSVAGLYNQLASPVLAAVRMAVAAAREAGIKVGVCGELASYPAGIKELASIGVDYISVSKL